jgi:hypothetical protein
MQASVRVKISSKANKRKCSDQIHRDRQPRSWVASAPFPVIPEYRSFPSSESRACAGRYAESSARVGNRVPDADSLRCQREEKEKEEEEERESERERVGERGRGEKQKSLFLGDISPSPCP